MTHRGILPPDPTPGQACSRPSHPYCPPMSSPPPPPPYAEVPSYPAPTLSTLSLPLLDRIMAHLTGPTSADPALASTKAERACRLWWVCREVRTVSRLLYLGSSRCFSSRCRISRPRCRSARPFFFQSPNGVSAASSFHPISPRLGLLSALPSPHKRSSMRPCRSRASSSQKRPTSSPSSTSTSPPTSGSGQKPPRVLGSERRPTGERTFLCSTR